MGCYSGSTPMEAPTGDTDWKEVFFSEWGAAQVMKSTGSCSLLVAKVSAIIRSMDFLSTRRSFCSVPLQANSFAQQGCKRIGNQLFVLNVRRFFFIY